MSPGNVGAAMQTDLEALAARLRTELEQGHYRQVIEAATVALVEFPGERQLLYLCAVAQRMDRHISDALETLAELERYHPRYSRVFQERGHCQVYLHDAPQAVCSFERAVQLNPALPSSWQSLQTLYRMTGRPTDAETARCHVAKLAQLPPPVTTARSMIADGDASEAEALLRPYLDAQPDDIEALRLLATIARDNEFVTDAEILLQRVLRLAPSYSAARYDYVLTLIDLHKHALAREQVEQLLAAEPNNPGARVTHATILMGLGQVEEAIAGYRQLTVEMPGDAEVRQSLGHALKTTGEQATAVECYRQAAQLRPGFGEPYWSLANLKTYRFEEAELAQMRKYETLPHAQQVDRYHLCFALGKGLEDRQSYAESFGYYARGNALRKEANRYRPGPQEHAARRLIKLCGEPFFSARAGWGSSSQMPIFILGLPRSGSTLLEQILASHSLVEGTMELADIPRLVGSLGGRQPGEATHYPDILSELTENQCRDFGADYLRDTLAYRKGKPRFIDKMPNNFRNIALIQLILPNAKIIDARRDPMDCCFSNF